MDNAIQLAADNATRISAISSEIEQRLLTLEKAYARHLVIHHGFTKMGAARQIRKRRRDLFDE